MVKVGALSFQVEGLHCTHTYTVYVDVGQLDRQDGWQPSTN